MSDNHRLLGIPAHWRERPTRRGGGTKYANPDNPHDTIRLMPGNPGSPNPAQQRPYVKRMKDGRALDAAGKPVDPRSREAHIPLDRFEFRE